MPIVVKKADQDAEILIVETSNKNNQIKVISKEVIEQPPQKIKEEEKEEVKKTKQTPTPIVELDLRPEIKQEDEKVAIKKLTK